MNELETRQKFETITKMLIDKKMTITTMESCTSGLVASLITDVEGASQVLKGAYVTYSNEAKIQNGVPKRIIDEYGVYSLHTAVSMAENCKALYNANIGVGITGTFGNVDPNNKDSIAGTVYFSIQYGEDGIYNQKIELPQMNSRYEYKITTANMIANALLMIISGL